MKKTMISRVISQGVRSVVKRGALVRPSVGLRGFSAFAPISYASSPLRDVIKTELGLANSVQLDNVESIASYIKENNLKVNVEKGKTIAHIIKDDSVHVFFNVDEFNHVQAEEEPDLDAFLVSVDVVIEKAGSTDSVVFSLLFQETQMIIDTFTVADTASALALFKANDQLPMDIYKGPKFADLDESIQTEVENFLAEKGIDAEFFDFIADFAENQEELEYRNWLKNLKYHFG